MKKTAGILLVLILCLTMVNITALAERKYEAEFSILGTKVAFNNPAYSAYDAVYVPLEELCGYLELTVSKNEDIYTVSRGEESVQLQLGNLVVRAGEQEVKMSVSPEEYNGVFYVPAEFFKVTFGMDVAISSDKRSADVNPNLYVVKIDVNNTAATLAAKPELNTVNKSSSGTNPLYTNGSFPEQEKNIYYMADLSEFANREMESAILTLKAKRGEYNPTLAVLRTAPWDSATICYNNRPQEYTEAAATSIAKETGVQIHNFNITSFVKNSLTAGEKLSLKLEGRPHSARLTTTTVKYDVQGAGTKNAPYITLNIKKSYNFPVKNVEEAKEDNSYNELMLLYSLGVFTEEDEFPIDMNDGVQRQEFVKYALRLRNTTVNKSGGNQFFSDVPADAPFYDSVMTAHSLGIVAGGEGAAFRPYDRITTGEAITILGRMLNYNIYAEERGGFTPGYFAAARYGELYLGSASENGELSFKKMISLFEDALDAKMLEVQSYTTDGNAKYIFNEDMTILSEFYSAKKIEGIVTANEYGSIIPGTDGKEGTIVIGSKELKLNYEPYNDFLGYKVRGWYNDEDELLYLGTILTSSTQINLADVENVTETANSVNFTYVKENNKRSNESFSKDATVIYNGKSVRRENVKASLLQADNGSVTLVGNDLVIIKAYSTIVVFAADSDEEEIYDLYEEYDKTLRLAETDYLFTNEDGKEVPLESITSGNVLSVAKSLDGKFVRGIISTRKAEGTIELIEAAATSDMILTIGGREYSVTNLDEEWTQRIKLGAKVTVYIDVFGNIAGCETVKSTQIFGYVIAVDESGKSALSADVEAAIMVRGNETYTVYQFADSVKIDGDKKKTTDEIKAAFNSGENSAFEPQGIIFEINNSGEISTVDTYYKDGQQAQEDPENTLQRRRLTTDGTIKYKSSGAVGGKFFLDTASALTVMKPETVESLEDYETVSGTLTNDKSYPFELYTIGVYTPEIIIAVTEGETSDSPGTKARLLLVDKTVTVFDSEGYEIKKLYYFDGKTRKSIIVPDENIDLVSDLERGDVIRIATDIKGELTAATKYFDYGTKTLAEGAVTNLNKFNAGNRTFGGYAEYINGKYVMVSSSDVAGDTSAKYTWMNYNSFKNSFFRYEVNSAGIEVIPATLEDIKTTTNVPFAPNGMIFHDHWASLRENVYLLEMNQPEGTGIYKLSYSAGTTDDVSGVSEEAVRCNNDGTVTVTATEPTREGHAFKYWQNMADGETYSSGDIITLTANTTLTAQWAQTPTHTVILKDTESSLSETISFSPMRWDKDSQQLVETKFTVPDAQTAEAYGLKKEGLKLIGWDGYEIGEEISVTGDIALEARMMKVWSGVAAAEAPELSDGYYLIETGEDLVWFSEQIKTTSNLKARLINDIYLNNFDDCGDGKQINETAKNWFDNSELVTAANDWTPYTIDAFAGEFDGNDKTIYGLYMKGGNSTGFFSSVKGGTVMNLTIKDAYLVSTAAERYNNYLGIVCGKATTATFDKITVSGSAIVAENCQLNGFGAIVGYGSSGTISINNCRNYLSVNAEPYGESLANLPATSGNNLGISGIAGKLEGTANALITNCSNYGNIYAPKTPKVGGIVGYLATGNRGIDACTNEGNITGLGSDVRGIYGIKGSSVPVTNSSSTGTITQK